MRAAQLFRIIISNIAVEKRAPLAIHERRKVESTSLLLSLNGVFDDVIKIEMIIISLMRVWPMLLDDLELMCT